MKSEPTCLAVCSTVTTIASTSIGKVTAITKSLIVTLGIETRCCCNCYKIVVAMYMLSHLINIIMIMIIMKIVIIIIIIIIILIIIFIIIAMAITTVIILIIIIIILMIIIIYNKLIIK